MKKIDLLRQWIKTKRIFSTTDIKRWAIENYLSSADVRCRELCREGFIDPIPDNEAQKQGLIKQGNQHIRWYRVHEQIELKEVCQGKQAQLCYV